MGKGLKVETAMHATDAASLLSQISLGLMEGALVIRSDGERHVFHPGQLIRLELKAHEEESEGRMQIEIYWRVPLNITPGAPLHESTANGHRDAFRSWEERPNG
jgi:amphi-Trp domain-containing protein